jgi:hypothetical protein
MASCPFSLNDIPWWNCDRFIRRDGIASCPSLSTTFLGGIATISYDLMELHLALSLSTTFLGGIVTISYNWMELYLALPSQQHSLVELDIHYNELVMENVNI